MEFPQTPIWECLKIPRKCSKAIKTAAALREAWKEAFWPKFRRIPGSVFGFRDPKLGDMTLFQLYFAFGITGVKSTKTTVFVIFALFEFFSSYFFPKTSIVRGTQVSYISNQIFRSYPEGPHTHADISPPFPCTKPYTPLREYTQIKNSTLYRCSDKTIE